MQCSPDKEILEIANLIDDENFTKILTSKPITNISSKKNIISDEKRPQQVLSEDINVLLEARGGIIAALGNALLAGLKKFADDLGYGGVKDPEFVRFINGNKEVHDFVDFIKEYDQSLKGIINSAKRNLRGDQESLNLIKDILTNAITKGRDILEVRVDKLIEKTKFRKQQEETGTQPQAQAQTQTQTQEKTPEEKAEENIGTRDIGDDINRKSQSITEFKSLSFSEVHGD